MTSPDDARQVAHPRLDTATEQLRDRTQRRAVEIADAVLNKAMSASRRSLPVQARPPHEHVHISDHVIIATLRQRIDATLRGAVVGCVYLRVDRVESLEELTIELFARYGEVLLDVADQARVVAAATLVDLLGPAAPPAAIHVSHIHISDITKGDPHLVDPDDEQLAPERPITG